MNNRFDAKTASDFVRDKLAPMPVEVRVADGGNRLIINLGDYAGQQFPERIELAGEMFQDARRLGSILGFQRVALRQLGVQFTHTLD